MVEGTAPKRQEQAKAEVAVWPQLVHTGAASNRRILAALTEDSRLSAAELGRRVGMSAPAVWDRVTRLEQAGVIRGYRADIDPAAIGLPVAAWVPDQARPGAAQDRRPSGADTRGQRVPPDLR